MELYDAAEKGDLAELRRLLAAGPKNNATDCFFRTPLHAACSNGHLEVVRLLLSGGADIDAREHMGSTPLHDACIRGHLEVVLELLSRGAKIDATDLISRTPLHEACVSGHLEIVRVLLERGAEIGTRNHRDRTPLHEACYGGHLEVVLLLLSRGAEIDARDSKDWTPLHDASYGGHPEVVDELLSGGAEMDARDVMYMTPLHIASRRGHPETAAKLILSGADRTSKNTNGQTPVELTNDPRTRALFEPAVKGCINFLNQVQPVLSPVGLPVRDTGNFRANQESVTRDTGTHSFLSPMNDLFAKLRAPVAPPPTAGVEYCGECRIPMQVSASQHERECPDCGAVEERITGEFDTNSTTPHMHLEGQGAHRLQKPLERTNPGPTTSPLERVEAEFAEFATRCRMRGLVAPLDPALMSATARLFVRAIAGYTVIDGKALVTRDGARRSLIAGCAELVCLRGLHGAGTRLPDLPRVCAAFEVLESDMPKGRKILSQLAARDPTFRRPDDRTALLLDPMLRALEAARDETGPAFDHREAVLAVCEMAAQLQVCHNTTERSRVAGALAFVAIRAAAAGETAIPLKQIAKASGPQLSTVKKCAETFGRYRSRFEPIFQRHGLAAKSAASS